MTHRDKFLLVLIWIRLDILNEDLADRFCFSSGVFSKTFITWIKILASLNGNTLIFWLPRGLIQSNLPSAPKKFSPKTRCIIDCTEILY